MIVLAVDSACETMSCAVSADGRLRGEIYANAGLKHSLTLMPAVKALLEIVGTRKEDLDAIAVTRGPGSFTGLRIGLATASALAYGLGLPVYSVSTLDALIAGAGPGDGPVCAMLDARRGEVYAKSPGFVPESAQPLASVLEKLRDAPSPLFTGDAAVKFREEIRLAVPGARFLPEALSYPRAWYALLAAEAGLGEKLSHDALRASYLRPSQAERQRKASS